MVLLQKRVVFVSISVIACIMLLLALHLLLSRLSGSLWGVERRVWGVNQNRHTLPAEDAGLGGSCATEGGSEKPHEEARHRSTTYSVDARDVHRAIENGDIHMVRHIMNTPYLQNIVLGDEQLLKAIADNSRLVEECMTDRVMLELLENEEAAERVLCNAVLRKCASRWAVDYLIALEDVSCAENGSPAFWHAVCEQDLERLLSECTSEKLAELAEYSGASEVFVGDGFPSMLRTRRGRELLDSAASEKGRRLGTVTARFASTCRGDTLVELVVLLSGSETIPIEFYDRNGQVVETREYNMRSTVFKMSEHINTCMRRYVGERFVRGKVARGPLVTLEGAPSVFDTVVHLADNKLSDIKNVLHLTCFLGIPGTCETELLYRRLASAVQLSRELDVKTSRGNAQRAKAYMLVLLREYVGAYGVLVGVDGDRAMLYPEKEDIYNNYASRNRACAVEKVSIMNAAMDSIRQGDKDAPSMLAWFMRGMDIHTLDVRWCSLDNDMARSIGSIESLTVLTMFGCSIHQGSIMYLKNLPNLEKLDVSQVLLDNQDVSVIAKMQRLVGLKAMSCGLAQGSLAHLSGLKRLENLDVSNVLVNRLRNSFNSVDMAAVGNMWGLKSLHMRMCDLELGCLWHLRTLATLSVLDVYRARLSVHEMSGIACLSSLMTLHMKDCSFDPGCLKYLADMRLLRELDVSWNVLSKDNMQEIANARSLAKLVMNRCGIDPGSLEHIAGLEALKELCVIDSTGINFQDKAVMRSLQARGVVVRS